MSTPPGQSGKKKSLRVIIPVALFLIAAAVLIYNNRRAYPVVDYAAAKKEAPQAMSKEAVSAESPEPASAGTPPKAAPTGTRKSAVIGPIVCATADTSRHCLQVGIKLVYAGTAVEREIGNKRENIERLVKFVFSTKQLAQINAESSRVELLGKINAFLSSGKAEDLVFTAFDIIPMEMK